MAGRFRGIVANVAGTPLLPRALRLRLLRALGAKVGTGTRISPYLRFIGGVAHVRIGRGCFVNVELLLGAGAPIDIGDRVLIGPRVQLLPTSHRLGPSEKRGGDRTVAPISIGSGCWLGAGVVVLGGVTIGPGSVIAAGAVVTGDVPADSLYGGVPARLLRTLDPLGNPEGGT